MHNADSKTRTAAALQHKRSETSPEHTGERASLFGNDTQKPFFNPPVQAKLTVNQPGDQYEQEADQVADKVVQRLAEHKSAAPSAEKANGQEAAQSNIQRVAITPIQRSVIQAKCADCEKEEQLQKKDDEESEVQGKLQRKPIFDSAAEPPDDGGTLQRKADWGAIQMKCAACEQENQVQRDSDAAAPTPSPDFSSRLQSSKGGGAPLPADVSSSMGEAMGADFSGVRVHTGSEAAGMSQSIQAQAFTHGSDIYFNEGKYDTGSTDGKRLLAHELVHTVQQSSTIQRRVIGNGRTSKEKQVPNNRGSVNNAQPPLKKENTLVSDKNESGKTNITRGKMEKSQKPKAPTKDTQKAKSKAKKRANDSKKGQPKFKGRKKEHRSKSKNQFEGKGKAVPGIYKSKGSASKIKLGQSDFQVKSISVTSKTNKAGTDLVLNDIKNKSFNYQSSFVNKVAEKTELIRSNVELQQQNLLTTGINQETQIAETFSHGRGKIVSQISTSKAQIATHTESQKNALEGQHTNALQHVSNTFQANQDKVSALSESYANQSVEAANNAAIQLQQNVQNATNEANEIGNRKARVSDSDSDVAEAKREAAHTIASDTATKTTESLSDGMDSLSATGPETASEFRKQGAEASNQLGQGKGQVDTQITDIFTNANTGIGLMSGTSSQSLDQTESQILDNFHSVENRLQNQLRQQVDQKISDLQIAGEQIQSLFRQQTEQALNAGYAQIEDLSLQVSTTEIREEQAPEAINSLDQGISAGFDTLNNNVDTHAQLSTENIIKKGSETNASLQTTSSVVSVQAANFTSSSTANIQQSKQQSINQITQAAAQGPTASSSIIGQVGTSLNQQVQTIEQNFQQGFAGYNIELNKQVNEGTERAREPVNSLPTRIDQGQERAAQRARRSWLENQLADFGEMLSDPGFWVGLLLAIALIVIIVLTGLTGGALLAVLVIGGAIIGAVSSIVSQATNGSFSQGWNWSRVNWAQVGKAALIGAVTGAVFALAGYLAIEVLGMTAGSWAFVGLMSLTAGIVTIVTNIATGQPWDKGLLANMLLAGLFARLSKYFPSSRNQKTPPPENESLEGCFIAGTVVLTEVGYKRIETIEVDEIIIGIDPIYNTTKPCKVIDKYSRSVDKLFEVTVGTTSIFCSSEHPFWVEHKGWLKACNLRPGMNLVSHSIGPTRIESIMVHIGQVLVFNISVDNLNTYMVSNDNIIVHNKAARARPSQFGWEDSPSWRQAAKDVDTPGTHKTISGKVPTQGEGEALIESGGGRILRVEEAHEPPNPHTYPHINYETSSGQRATIKIQSAENPYNHTNVSE